MEKKKGKVIFPWIVLAALLVILAVAGTIALTNTPAKRYQKQLDLGDRYLEELNYEKAIAAYEAAIRINPENAEAYVGLARAYVGDGDKKSAIDAYKDAISNGTKDVKVYAELADLYVEMGKLKEAEKVLKKGIKVTDSDKLRDQLDELLMAMESTNEETAAGAGETTEHETGEVEVSKSEEGESASEESVAEQSSSREETVAETKEAEIDFNKWRKAYLKFLDEELPRMEEYRYEYQMAEYGFVYVDQDSVPELFIRFPSEACGTLLCATDGESVSYQYVGNGFRYADGMVWSADGAQGSSYNSFFAVKNHGIEWLATGWDIDKLFDYDPNYHEMSDEAYDFFWEDETGTRQVSCAEYQTLQKELWGDRVGRYASETKSYDDMCWDLFEERESGGGF